MKYLASSLVAVADIATFAYLLMHNQEIGAIVCLIAGIAVAAAIAES